MDQIRVPVEDEKGLVVRIRFQDFLQSYNHNRLTDETAQIIPSSTQEEELTQQM